MTLQARVFVQQAARETKSAEGIIRDLSVSVEQLRDFFATDEYNYLRELEVRPLLMRGADVGSDGRNERTWAEMEIGDVALIAWHGHIEAAGEIVMRKDSPALAKLRHHDRYHFLYFLRNVERIHVPYASINDVLGYKANNSFQRFQGLDEEQSAAVLGLLRRIAPTLPALSKETLVRRAIEGNLDQRTEVNRRCEQGLLRRLYFGQQDEGRCAFCGRVFPVDFLVAAHIKRRADCSDEERRDAESNIIPACRFGCDELFERGYVLGVEGAFMKSPGRSATEAVANYISLIEGRPVEGWDRRRKYFEWHAQSHA
jgi:hypothetical protein